MYTKCKITSWINEKQLQDKGTTAIPLNIFVKSNMIKIKIGVATGKKMFDKRNSIKEKDLKRELQRNNV